MCLKTTGLQDISSEDRLGHDALFLFFRNLQSMYTVYLSILQGVSYSDSSVKHLQMQPLSVGAYSQRGNTFGNSRYEPNYMS